jgi:ADP-ribose pyrophosphatase YjhB (NUDIX family)
VLLVTSRETGRWIIPKGGPIKGFKPAKTAAREAYEDAGALAYAYDYDYVF